MFCNLSHKDNEFYPTTSWGHSLYLSSPLALPAKFCFVSLCRTQLSVVLSPASSACMHLTAWNGCVPPRGKYSFQSRSIRFPRGGKGGEVTILLSMLWCCSSITGRVSLHRIYVSLSNSDRWRSISFFLHVYGDIVVPSSTRKVCVW